MRFTNIACPLLHLPNFAFELVLKVYLEDPTLVSTPIIVNLIERRVIGQLSPVHQIFLKWARFVALRSTAFVQLLYYSIVEYCSYRYYYSVQRDVFQSFAIASDFVLIKRLLCPSLSRLPLE